MGTVYEAVDKERNVRVALKTLRAMNAESLLRFKHEFRDFQDLQHPNLVSVGELFSDEGEWFFTMELIEGVNFLEYVRPGTFATGTMGSEDDAPTVQNVQNLLASPRTLHAASSGSLLNEARLRIALKQLALGLHALHEAGKVHRDIKPSNVLVTHHGRVVVLDFGLAAEIARSEQLSEVDIVGTVEYMAPEQAAARQVGPAADWYAVGVVLYEALTGQLPLSGPPIEVLMNKQRLDAPSPKAINPLAPDDLATLCSELLRFNPGARPTGKTVLDRLGAHESASRSSGSLSSFSTSSSFIGRAAPARAAQGALRSLATVRADGAGARRVGAGQERAGAALRGEAPVARVGRSDPGRHLLRARVGAVQGRRRARRRAQPVHAPPAEGGGRRAPAAPRRAVGAGLPGARPRRSARRGAAHAEEVLDPQELRSRLFAALRELLSRLSDRHPLVLVIDDLQWADVDSLALLGEVMRPPDAPCLLLIATVRSEESESGPARLHALAEHLRGELLDLHLERMSADEARELAETLVRRAPGQTPLNPVAIAQEAGGHPLFIDELIRHAVAVGSTTQAPLQLEDALWARISQLDGDARRILELVALASGRLVQQTAAQAAAISFGDLTKHIALLRVSHLLRTTGMRGSDFIEPYHDRVRKSVLARLDGATLRHHHRRLAVALETSGQADPEALAVHWRDAGEPAKAAHFAQNAAEKAAKALAFDRAASFYQLAIELRGEAATYALHAKLADALAYAGRGDKAGDRYLIAAQMAPTADDAIELNRKAAEQLLRSGHIDRGLETIERVLAAVGMKMPATPRSALASLAWYRARLALRGLKFKERSERELPASALQRIDICWSIAAGLSMVDNFRALDYQTRQLLLALGAGEPSRVARALALEAPFIASPGEPAKEKADRLLARAVALSERIGTPELVGFVTMTSGVVRFLQGRFAEGCALSDAAETMLRERCSGLTWEYETSRFISLWSRFYRGDVRELMRRLPPLLREAKTRGNLYALTNLRTAFTPFAFLVEDKLAAAEREADDAMSAWSRSGFHIQHCNALLSNVQTALYAGDGERARALLTSQWQELERSMVLRVQQIRVRAVHFRSCVAAASGAAPSVVERDAVLLQKEKAPWAHALGTLMRATARRLDDDADAALELLARAVEELTAADISLYATAARRRLGVAMGNSAGAAEVAAAEAWFAEQGIRNGERMAAMLVPAW